MENKHNHKNCLQDSYICEPVCVAEITALKGWQGGVTVKRQSVHFMLDA